MPNVVAACHHCGATIALLPQQKIARSDACGKCDADLHCCRNCRFFDPGRNNQCAEPQAEWVSEKERANFCGYFEPRTKIDLVNRAAADDQDSRRQFDSLFKKR